MKKRILIDLIIISILGLLPFLWFKDGSVLLGHDAGLALDPIMHFLDRIHVWSQRFSLGTDQNGALLGAFFIHGFEALLAWLGLNLHWGQIVQFVFWFVVPGFSMYYVAYKLFPDKKYLPLIASVVYMLNFYLLQGWFIAERTKFSIYTAFPLVIYFAMQYLRGRMGLIKSVLLTGVILGVFNGGGSIPLYGGLGFGLLVTYVYINVINFNFVTLKRTFLYSIGVGIVYFVLNAYWIIPYAFYIVGFFGRDLALAGGSEGALTWAKYLSSQSTFINLFRGQGIPDWYLNPYHAYAQSFLSNPLLIFVSFLLPILAFSALWFVKSRRDSYIIYLIVLICLVGILFSSGPESQFGFIYSALVTYVPGFAMFRSAFFKFNYLVWFSYAILIGFALDYILNHIELRYFKKYALWFSNIALILLTAGYVLYHYPVLDGSFLDYSREPGNPLTTRVKVPDYVFEFGKWTNSQDPNTRYLSMPQLGENPYIMYEWRYWSIAPLTSLLSRNSFVRNTGLAPESERLLMNEMYAAFLRDDMQSFLDFTDVFAIDGIVLEKDYDFDNPTWPTVNPAKYEVILNKYKDLFIHQKTYGEWIVYSLSKRAKSLRVNSSTKLSFLQGKLSKVVSFPYFAPKSPLFMSDVEQKSIDYYAKNASDIFLAPECVQCDLEYKEGTFKYYNPKLLPGSIFYPIITFGENKVRAASSDFASLANYFITTSNRRIIEVKWMVDSRTRIDKILPTIERYRDTLRELKTHLSKDEWSESAKEENKIAQMVINHILGQVNLLDSAYKGEILSYFHRLTLAEAYNEILDIEKLVNKKLWVTEDMENKKYIYDLSIFGDYEIYAKIGSLTDPRSDTSQTSISIKNSDVELKPQGIVGDWLSFGTYNFRTKKIFISLKDGTLVNYLDNLTPIFADGTEGIKQDGSNFSFSVDSLNKCFFYQLRDLEYLNTQYVVSFKYRNFSDKNKLSFFHQVGEDEILRYSIKDSEQATARYFKNFTKLITPKDGNIRLYFCNGFLSLDEISGIKEQGELDLLPEGQTLIELVDITFHKVAYPNIVLYKKQKDIIEEDTVESFTKNNPVTYTVNLAKADKPASLIMRESFGKYWRVCDEDSKCLSYDDPAHFATGGFANAWYLNNGSSKKLTLYYYPQTWYFLGTVITLVGAVIIVTGGIWLILSKRR